MSQPTQGQPRAQPDPDPDPDPQPRPLGAHDQARAHRIRRALVAEDLYAVSFPGQGWRNLLSEARAEVHAVVDHLGEDDLVSVWLLVWLLMCVPQDQLLRSYAAIAQP